LARIEQPRETITRVIATIPNQTADSTDRPIDAQRRPQEPCCARNATPTIRNLEWSWFVFFDGPDYRVGRKTVKERCAPFSGDWQAVNMTTSYNAFIALWRYFLA